MMKKIPDVELGHFWGGGGGGAKYFIWSIQFL